MKKSDRKASKQAGRHLMIIGGTRTGKGNRILASDLLDMCGNRPVLVIDPKGEAAALHKKLTDDEKVESD